MGNVQTHPSTQGKSVQPEQASAQVLSKERHWRGGHTYTLSTSTGQVTVVEVPQVQYRGRARGYREHFFYLDEALKRPIGSVIQNWTRRKGIWFADPLTKDLYTNLECAAAGFVTTQILQGALK